MERRRKFKAQEGRRFPDFHLPVWIESLGVPQIFIRLGFRAHPRIYDVSNWTLTLSAVAQTPIFRFFWGLGWGGVGMLPFLVLAHMVDATHMTFKQR